MFDIIGKRYWFFALSLVIIVPGLVAMGILWTQTGSPLRLAIDFTGGTLWEITAVEKPLQPGEVRELLHQAGITEPAVQTVEQQGKTGYLIRAKHVDTETKAKAETALRAAMGTYVEQQFTAVGPAVGAEVAQRAAMAVVLASIGILAYISFAFRKVPKPIRYGTAAVIALVHDVFVLLGSFAILGLVSNVEVDALFLTATLTVIGFSVHDTIVVFDRIRENMKKFAGEPFDRIVNHSILQTLGRSINTSMTVVMTLMALFLFGGVTVRYFVLCLLIGIISGTYSSICNASPILVVWETGELRNLFRRKPAGNNQ